MVTPHHRPHHLLELEVDEEPSVLSLVLGFLPSVSTWFCDPEYRGYLLVNVGISLAYTPVQACARPLAPLTAHRAHHSPRTARAAHHSRRS